MGTTRERMKEKALRLFVEKGYAGTSIADIERAAGLAPRTGAFYRHFSSKAALAAEIGATSIIETRKDLGFDGVLPLGDTRAELVLIAKGYRNAAGRQAALGSLLSEIRSLKEIRELEDRVDVDLGEALVAWLAEKPYARGMSRERLFALLLSMLGGWIFFLSKRSSAAAPAGLTDDLMLDQWARFWASVLEGKPPRKSRN